MRNVSIISDLEIPKVYAYTTTEFEKVEWKLGDHGVGLLKVGFTSKNDVEERISQQFPTLMPKKPWILKFVDSAVTGDVAFSDHDVHRKLIELGRKRVNGEWFECTVDDIENVIRAIRTKSKLNPTRLTNFVLRPEQMEAVEKSAAYFSKVDSQDKSHKRFLWNAKMRFGKSFTAYKLAEKMKWERILILTWKPAVVDSWQNDLEGHVDFEDWQFIKSTDEDRRIKGGKPTVWFASFQDVLGKAQDGKVKPRVKEILKVKWDIVILDEYHYGAWNENSASLFATEKISDLDRDILEESIKVDSRNYLYLSGTPFRALANGEFLEDQIYTWTYTDEQRAKIAWQSSDLNPYSSLPKMTLMTYVLPSDIRNIAESTDENEFDLSEFFSAKTHIDEFGRESHKFKHEADVQKWLNLIRGQHLPFQNRTDGEQVSPPIPFDDIRLLGALRHTLWYLPSVAACKAMGVLLKEPANAFFHSYEIVVAAGESAGIGVKALEPVRRAITNNGTQTRSITLTCSKLNTGVTVPEWTGIFMLSNLSSPETYFQTAFRVQSPWTIKMVDGKRGMTEYVVKPTCYIFDFAPNRALRLISEYSTQLDLDPDASRREKVQEFLNYLPVLCFDGYVMQELKATTLLNWITHGTASTMLARKWQDSRLVDVGNAALSRLLEHPDLVLRLEKFEAFAKLKTKLEQTIAAEKSLKKLKSSEDSEDKNKKKIASDEQKKLRTFRKQLQENLKIFAARIPVFMYLTDFREETLKDVIINLEPELFEKVTNLQVSDFELLCRIGIFNEPLMDSAVYQFRRLEDSSLHYIDIFNKDEAQKIIGGFLSSYATKDDVIKGLV